VSNDGIGTGVGSEFTRTGRTILGTTISHSGRPCGSESDFHV